MKSRVLICVAIFLQFLLQLNGQVQRSPLSTSTCGRRSPAITPLMVVAIRSTRHWPWHAAIYQVNITRQGSPTIRDEDPKYACGGSLINTNTVLTAAHCICRFDRPLDAENVLVLLGKLNLSELSTSELLKAAKIIPHQNYSHVDLRNDIAMIKLSAAVTFDNHVRPICLWDENKLELSEVVGKIGTVVGWGLQETGSLPDVLQEATMPVREHAVCLESDRDFYGSVLSTKNFCAGFGNGTSACNGDSGGSMSFKENGIYYIRGIVSFIKVDEIGEKCDPNKFTVFTDVAKYFTWIAEYAEAKCEKRVSCEFDLDGTRCLINLNTTLADRHCRVKLEDLRNKDISLFGITGNVEALPDLTDVVDKLKNLSDFDLSGIKLKFIERSKLFAARRSVWLDLSRNVISEISSDTFNDLSELDNLDLDKNRLKVIHRDVFKKLYKLRQISLSHNKLEILPEGLFRNNRELESAWFSSNKIKIIETDFRDLPKLNYLDLDGNKCIDDIYNSQSDAYNSRMEFQSKIMINCIPNNLSTPTPTQTTQPKWLGWIGNLINRTKAVETMFDV